MKRAEISGWGCYPKATCLLTRPERHAELIPTADPCIARGQGRGYGDCALNTNHDVILTERVNRLLSFDGETGILRAEAGVTLSELLEVFVPRGWFLPVTPGTKYASLGGCVAADVHGKNHHQDGAFSACVHEIELVLADGSYRRCSPAKDPDLFWATVGGMGLTGIITEVALQMRPLETAYMVVRHYGARNLDAALQLLDSADRDDQYTVAWIDCLAKGGHLGRSVVMAGHHALPDDLPRTVENILRIKKRGQKNLPFDLPPGVLNSWSMKAFNNIYYRFQSLKKGAFVTDYDRFFYPLDSIGNWNRMYGKRGFVQYQCIIPLASARHGLQLLLEAVA
ncbi:MAG: FAD-binding oxidoreductase, partial [Nitrospirota bacterium]|nr:FAD-binding oxidoreductase [Nitrospirota bacterium]